MTFVGQDISSIYKDICSSLVTYGACVSVRSLKTLEISNAQIQLYNPRNRIVNFRARDLSMKYFVGELCYFLGGRTDLASIAHYSKFWHSVSDDGVSVNSAYGARLFTLNGHYQIQFDYAIRNLVVDKDSRKAVMTIYQPEDSRESKDNPCTIFLQLIIRNNKLDMYTFMRSNDIWLGTPYDVAFFTIVQEIALVKLQYTYPELRLGTYFHNATSLHAYERHWNAIARLGLEGSHVLVKVPRLTPVDVSSWFNDLLTYEKSKRKVVLYKNESEQTQFQTWCKKFLD